MNDSDGGSGKAALDGAAAVCRFPASFAYKKGCASPKKRAPGKQP